MPQEKLLDVTPITVTESYSPVDKSEESVVRAFVKGKVKKLKDNRRDRKYADGRSIEDTWKEVDLEYAPHELKGLDTTENRFVTDETLGIAGRRVRLDSDDAWQSNHATPDFYVKVNTALAALIDQNPEAVFEPTSRKYESNTALAQANWKQSWHTSGGKRALKNGILNMSRYGIGFWCTTPKIDVRDKKVRVEFNKDDSSKDVYETKKITRYNGLARRSLNPWDVWVNDGARPGMFDEIGEWYYEREFSEEEFKLEYPVAQFPNAQFVRANAQFSDNENNKDNDDETKKDKIRVGYYENDRKDLFVIWVPGQDIPLYNAPMPNDEGKLSLWYAPWSPRDDRTIYGIGLFEIIRGDTILFDRVLNMTMDQLTLSIYKSFFHKGTDQLGEDGTLRLQAGKGQAVSDPSSIKWLDVPGPGQDAWRGLQYLQDKRDINSGVPQQLAGKFSGKTLGQDLQAKEAALERMKLPLDYLLDALEQEAYLTLSWLSQILSTPEVLEYSDETDLRAALSEMGLGEEEIKGYFEVLNSPSQDQELFAQDVQPQEGVDEMGMPLQPQVKNYAKVYPEAVLNMDKDSDGNLFESEQRKFYRFGLDIPTKRLNWKGMIRVLPQSVLAPSKELTRRLDLDLFNLVYPSIQAMVQAPAVIPVLIHPIKQIIKSFNKNPKDWLDEKFLMEMHEAAKQPQDKTGENVRPSLSLQFADLSDRGQDGAPRKLNSTQKEVLKRYYGIEVQEPLFVGGEQDANAGMPPSGMPQKAGGRLPSPEFSTKSGVEAPQVADIGHAPHRMEGAVEAANRVF